MSRNRRQVASLENLRLNAQQQALAVAAGLAPPLQWKTGKVEDEDDVWVREEKGRRPVYYHGDVHNVWTTMGIYQDEDDANEKALKEVERRRAADRAKLVGGSDIRLVPLRDVADYYLWVNRPDPTSLADAASDARSDVKTEKERRRRAARQNYRKKVASLDRIVAWFARAGTVGDATLAEFRRYILHRIRDRARPNTRNQGRIKPQTAAADARWLAAAINQFAREHGSAHRVSVDDLPRAERREFHLDRETYVRLLVTLRRGWIWDTETDEWQTEIVFDPESGSEVRRKVVHPAFAREGYRARFRGRMAQRTLILGVNGGMRPGGLCALGWGRDPDRGWIDVDNGRVNQSGSVARPKRLPSGKKVPGNKRASPVPMPRQLRVLAEIWRKADARIGASHVIQKFGGQGTGYSGGALLELIKQGGERICIPRGELCLHTMRHSCITMLLEANVPPQMVADFVDDDVRTIKEWYSHLGLDKPWLRDGKPVPIRNPLEALEWRDRGPKLAKEARIVREAEQEDLVRKERAKEARRRRAKLRLVA